MVWWVDPIGKVHVFFLTLSPGLYVQETAILLLPCERWTLRARRTFRELHFFWVSPERRRVCWFGPFRWPKEQYGWGGVGGAECVGKMNRRTEIVAREMSALQAAEVWKTTVRVGPECASHGYLAKKFWRFTSCVRECFEGSTQLLACMFYICLSTGVCNWVSERNSIFLTELGTVVGPYIFVHWMRVVCYCLFILFVKLFTFAILRGQLLLFRFLSVAAECWFKYFSLGDSWRRPRTSTHTWIWCIYTYIWSPQESPYFLFVHRIVLFIYSPQWPQRFIQDCFVRDTMFIYKTIFTRSFWRTLMAVRAMTTYIRNTYFIPCGCKSIRNSTVWLVYISDIATPTYYWFALCGLMRFVQNRIPPHSNPPHCPKNEYHRWAEWRDI